MIPLAIIDRLQLQRRAMIACALIPLVAFSSLPAYGCICTDGHFELCCNSSRFATSNYSQVNSKAANDCCGRSCCAHRVADGRSRSCCQRKSNHGLASRTSQTKLGETSITGKRCCTPVARADTLATVANSLKAVDDHHLRAIDDVTVEIADSHIGARPRPHFLADVGPPPDDLVVTLRRLVI